MGDLFALMHNGSRALTAHRAAMATASHNIENVNTPGFTRQRANLAATPSIAMAGIGMLGTGVTLASITQAKDRFLEARLPSMRATAGAAETRAATLDAITAFDSSGINVAGRLGDFFSSLSALQARPADMGSRQAAIASAADFGRAVNAAAADIHSARAAVDTDLRARAPELQQLVSTVASLNKEIAIAAASGGPPNDLLDQRQVALDALSSQLGATVTPGAGHAVTVTLPGGNALVVGDHAAKIGTATAPDGRLLLSIGGTDGSPAKLVDGKQVGGAVGGLFQARDVDLKDAADQLDTFTFDFASTVNAAHQSGIALDGSSGRDLFFVGASSSGAARRLAVTDALKADASLLGLSATGASGDAGALATLLAARDTALSTGSDVFSTLATMTSSFGEKARSASLDQASSTSLLAHGVALRESVSGVSVDEELVNIQAAERAFQAASKVIGTADSMLQTILDLKK